MEELTKTLSGAYDPLTGPEASAYRTSAEANRKDAIAQTRRGAAMRREFSSTGAVREEGRVNTATANALNTTLAGLYSKDRQNRIGASSNALNLGKFESEEDLRKAQNLQSLGGLARSNEISNIQNIYNEFIRQRNEQGTAQTQALGASNQGNPIYGQTSYDKPTAFGQVAKIVGPALLGLATGGIGGLAGLGAGAGAGIGGLGAMFSNAKNTNLMNMFNAPGGKI